MNKKGLYEKLIEYSSNGRYPFHMPGHKRNGKLFECNDANGNCKNHVNNENSIDPYDIDITEIDGFDNLHNAKGIIKEAEDFAANLLGAKKTWFLVNGSTCGIHSAINSVCGIGDAILVARNCHKAVYHAIENRNLKAEYLYPEYSNELHMYGGINPADVEEALSNNKAIKAVVITSPTYDGVISDVETISQIVHKHGSVLIVDEAHGAHLGVSSQMPEPAYKLGADIVIESAHKTLEAMTQTGLLHLGTDAVAAEVIEKQLAVYETSSPSYVLMASIDKAMRDASVIGDKKVEQLLTTIRNFREVVNNLSFFSVVFDELKNELSAYEIDETKINICIKNNVLTGKELANILRNEYNIEVEMEEVNRVLLYATMGDNPNAFDMVAEALRNIDDDIVNNQPKTEKSLDGNTDKKEENVFAKNNNANNNNGNNNVAEINHLMLNTKMTIYDAINAPSKKVKLADSEGMIAADYVFVYPPGSPIIVPGEIISADVIKYVSDCINNDLNVCGINDNMISVIE